MAAKSAYRGGGGGDGGWEEVAGRVGRGGRAGVRLSGARTGDQLHLELGLVTLAQHRGVGQRHEAHLVERLPPRGPTGVRGEKESK